MKKEKVYQLAVFYQIKVLGVGSEKPVEFSFSDGRYFRDSFAKIMKKGEEIEKDRQEILKIKAEKKKADEMNKLLNEVVDITLDKNLVSRMDKAGIKLAIGDLKLFE